MSRRKPKATKAMTTHSLAEDMRRKEQTFLPVFLVRIVYYTQYQRFMSKCP